MAQIAGGVEERLSAAHITGDVKERLPISMANVLDDRPLAEFLVVT